MRTEQRKQQRFEQPALQNLRLPNAVAFDPARDVVAILKEHPLVAEALDLLRRENPKDLVYHSYQHTEEVLYETVRLALKDKLSEDDVTLLAIAAAWHDTGFIKSRTANEPIGALYAREAMSKRHYSEEQIRDVETAILDTQLKFNRETNTLEQRATGRLSGWLLDADLANFGKDTFFRKSLLVYQEFSGVKATRPDDLRNEEGRKYIATTLRLCSRHQYHTQAAKDLFSAQEQLNIQRLCKFLTALTGGMRESLQRAWDDLWN